MPRFKHIRESGVVFVFKYDADDPALLHIYARHLTTPREAIDRWFDETADEVWNERYERFETRNETHQVYWIWLEEGERVLIITCLRREDEG